MQERLRRASELEAMVRSHNTVIETIHAQHAILPAKLGIVYPHSRDIVWALRSGCDTLLPRLHRLTGCDEWAVHIYADRAVVQDHVAAQIPTIGRLREEYAAARPGRAYFLERQLRGELESATRQALVALAQSTFGRLIRYAVAGEVNPVSAVADDAREVEILRAAFLVTRDAVEDFHAQVCSSADTSEGLRGDYSGPWPPYSFAIVEAEEAV